ncbi:hypothetical protein TWF694_006966 [Orbilia ellipsospora]|uniref:Uncharacterized protein n=1 Tax=Orbilia ellipsospora TaxID=2528407 RepID=A0AAV9XNF2_9PEZI
MSPLVCRIGDLVFQDYLGTAHSISEDRLDDDSLGYWQWRDHDDDSVTGPNW